MIKVADEVWVATATLHRDHPDQPDFTVQQIVERARELHLAPTLRPGVYQHAQQHCVANRPPNPAAYRMLFETAPKRRRLFRPGDPCDWRRAESKSAPSARDLPAPVRELLAWYQAWELALDCAAAPPNSFLALRGSGRELWKDEHADEYIRRLREGWD